MNYSIIKRILFNSIVGAVLCNYCIYSQNCPDDSYTYFEDDDIPANVTVLDQDNCFSNDDLAVLDSVFILNDLGNEYESSLHMGTQTWATMRLKIWVATYIQGGNVGITQKINQLPANFDQLSELTTLYLEKHDLTELPDSFSQLSSLVNFYVSNNWLTSLPEDFGSITSLVMLDLGYNQLESIPESIGGLENLEYLFLFNNQLTSLPETICDLSLDWDGISPLNYPYFACGGNYLCDCELIPDCVENSVNVNISMEQNYYSFLLDLPQDCPSACQDCIIDNICPSLGDLNGDVCTGGSYNVLDIVLLANCVLTQSCANDCIWVDYEGNDCGGATCTACYGCAADLNGDDGYNVLDIVILANCVLAGNCGG